MTEAAWRPSPDYVERANLTRFMRANGIKNYTELVSSSIRDIEWFWDAVVTDLRIEFFTPYHTVVDTSRGIQWATWFVGGTTNVAHNCVEKTALQRPDSCAVIWEGEDGAVRRLTYGDLRQEVRRLVAGLGTLSIQAGDVVGIYAPMVPETVIMLYACASIGAFAVPMFSGFAAGAVAARLQDSRAKLLMTVDGFRRRGEVVPLKEIADEAVAASPTVEHVLIYRHLGRDIPWAKRRDIDWNQLAAVDTEYCEHKRLDSEHPLLIAYTSGTTGRPKGAVHVQAGLLVKIAQEAAYQFDLHSDDTLFWFTDMGWIMGPWEVIGAGANGACLLLYEGAPDYPAPDRLWAMVERHKVSVLGLSPSLVRALIPHGERHVISHDLSSLRILGSTGEPWNPEPWQWYFEKVGGARCPVINFSGGTEVGGSFLSSTPLMELRPCTVGAPTPGMAVDILDPTGKTLPPGNVGELVCTKPWPSMTRGIWGDPDRYLDAYWSRWHDVWWHGDWASRDEDGLWFLHGRSDDTLNIAGKRLGPAEVESILLEHREVAESAAIGVPDSIKGEKIWCFVVLLPDTNPTERLRDELAALVAGRLGKAFRPDTVHLVRELPKTRSGKIMRRVIRAALLGDDPGDLSSLDNPTALRELSRLA